jgi:hypothetical protein
MHAVNWVMPMRWRRLYADSFTWLPQPELAAIWTAWASDATSFNWAEAGLDAMIRSSSVGARKQVGGATRPFWFPRGIRNSVLSSRVSSFDCTLAWQMRQSALQDGEMGRSMTTSNGYWKRVRVSHGAVTDCGELWRIFSSPLSVTGSGERSTFSSCSP